MFWEKRERHKLPNFSFSLLSVKAMKISYIKVYF